MSVGEPIVSFLCKLSHSWVSEIDQECLRLIIESSSKFLAILGLNFLQKKHSVLRSSVIWTEIGSTKLMWLSRMGCRCYNAKHSSVHSIRWCLKWFPLHLGARNSVRKLWRFLFWPNSNFFFIFSQFSQFFDKMKFWINQLNCKKACMLCLKFEPGAGLKAQLNPQSYGSPQKYL